MRFAIVIFVIQLALLCRATVRNSEKSELKALLLRLLEESADNDLKMSEPQGLEVNYAVKRNVILGCQSGQGEIGYTTTQLGKSNSISVSFNPPFSEVPAVVWGLTYLDSIATENVRINSEVQGLTATGITLKINSWSPTLTYNAKVSWMACPK